MNMKPERRHVAGLNHAQGKNAQVSAVGDGKPTTVAVSRLQVGAPTSSWPVSKSERNERLSSISEIHFLVMAP